MKITRLYDLTFRMESEFRKGHVHVIDLAQDSCTCENWVCRLSKAEGLSPTARRCKHLLACREKLVDLVLTEWKHGRV